MENLEKTFIVKDGQVFRILTKSVAQVCDIATAHENPDIYAITDDGAVNASSYEGSRAQFWNLSDTFALRVGTTDEIQKELGTEPDIFDKMIEKSESMNGDMEVKFKRSDYECSVKVSKRKK